MKENKIIQLSDIQHSLLRPGQYIGSTTLTKCSTFVLNEEDETFEYKEIEYVPGFLKIIYEIIDNSVDEAIRTNFKFGTNIDIKIEKNIITVSDNGRGIPLDKDEKTGLSQLELALTSLRAGSNFNDDEGRTLLGMNGVGASLTNIFSRIFAVVVLDKKRKGILKCANNLSKKSCEIIDFKSKTSGTTIMFEPDYKRFGLKGMDETHINLIHQRLMFLSITYPEIQFKLNGNVIKFKNNKNFMECFNKDYVVIQDKNKPSKYMIGIIPNEYDDFTHKSYINGADCINGGNHIDYIHSEVVGRIKEKLSRKYPNIKVGDIKNKLTYIVNFREFVNPMFNSQTKENFSSNVNEIKAFLKDIDWDDFVNKITRNSAIIEPIVETFKIKEEFKNRETLKKLGKTTKDFKCAKFLPATKTRKYFAICEGDSAKQGLSDGLGRAEIGYFSTRGVPLNAYEVAPQKIAANEELENIIKCLKLHLKEDTQPELTYEKIVLANDSDADGSHIMALYIAFFSKYAPSVIKEKRLCALKLPLICMKDSKGNIIEMFRSFDEYNNWAKENKNTKLECKYYKGLGSWKDKEIKALIAKHGIDKFIEPLELDKDSLKLIDDWVGKKNADIRKEYLKQNEFDIFGI